MLLAFVAKADDAIIIRDGSNPSLRATVSNGALSVVSASPIVSGAFTNSTATSDGTVAAGAISVQFIAGDGATVTVNGMAVAAGGGLFFPPANKLYPAITYTVSGGNLYLSIFN